MKFILLLLILFNVSILSYETQGILENISSYETIPEGTNFRAKLVIWPYESNDEEEFYQLVDKEFLNFFYVSRVSKIERSKNNELAVEIYLSLVLKRYFLPTKFYIFNHRDLNIPISLKNIIPQRTNQKAQDFYVYKQVLKNQEKVSWWIWLVTFVVLTGLIILMIKFKKKKKEVVEIIEIEAKDRKGFEKLYKQKEAILEQNIGKRALLVELMNEIDKLQYRPLWKDEELDCLVIKLKEIHEHKVNEEESKK